MSTDNWPRIGELFDRVLESEDPSLIDQEPDPQVAAEVRRLWASHLVASESGYLDEPITLVRNLQKHAEAAANDLLEAQAPILASGMELASGRFLVEGQLGEGGMGQVYLARDRKLGKPVALKTIHRDLASNPAIRTRFIEEVKSAQAVSHVNVCRIHDIFEQQDLLFYSMDYLPGPTLAQFDLRAGSKVAMQIALQLAEGLNAAHRTGIIHRDFKPQNVILVSSQEDAGPAAPTVRAVITDFGLARPADAATPANGNHSGDDHARFSLQGAGTLDYMAPELVSREAPASVQSDIFAYGKVLQKLLPASRWCEPCTAQDPQRRPSSLEPVIGDLRGDSKVGRRAIVMSATIAAGALGLAGYSTHRLRSAPRFALGASSQRLFLNGLAAEQSLQVRAFSLRQLILTGLRQSPLIRVIPDEKMFAQLKRLRRAILFPLPLDDLLTAARQEQAAAIVDGAVARTAEGLRLSLRIFAPGDKNPVFELVKSVPSDHLAIQLAQEASTALRREFAESPLSLANSNIALEQITSAAPEAVDLYFRAITEYERGDVPAALTYLDRALGIDAKFPLAHLYKAQCLRGVTRPKQALASAAEAYASRNQVTERERNWIEYFYHDLSANPGAAFDAIRKNTVLFPDEPQFQRFAATALAKQGRFREALPFSRTAVALDEFGVHNRGELIANLAESGAADEAIAKHDEFRKNGATDNVIENGYIFALLLKDRFADADRAIDRVYAAQSSSRWTGLQSAASAVLQGRLRSSLFTLEGDLSYDEMTGEDRHLIHRLVHVAYLRLLLDGKAVAFPYIRRLCESSPWPSNLYALRVGSSLAAPNGFDAEAAKSLAALRTIAQKWPSQQATGAAANAEANILRAQGDHAGAWRQLQIARGVWPDPLTYFSLLEHAASQPGTDFATEALAAAASLDGLRGKVLKSYFAGLLVLGEVFRGKVYQSLSRFPEAIRSFRRVDFHWGACAEELEVMRSVRASLAQLSGQK